MMLVVSSLRQIPATSRIARWRCLTGRVVVPTLSQARQPSDTTHKAPRHRSHGPGHGPGGISSMSTTEPIRIPTTWTALAHSVLNAEEPAAKLDAATALATLIIQGRRS